MPSKYIYEPWLAPIEVQRKAGCIIGQDYPRPIVDHASASKACIARIGAAYKAGRCVGLDSTSMILNDSIAPLYVCTLLHAPAVYRTLSDTR